MIMIMMMMVEFSVVFGFLLDFFGSFLFVLITFVDVHKDISFNVVFFLFLFFMVMVFLFLSHFANIESTNKNHQGLFFRHIVIYANRFSCIWYKRSNIS